MMNSGMKASGGSGRSTATGPDAEPVMPTWPGMASFGGLLIHAGQFRNTAEMAGRDVLVVGPENSGVDLLNHLVRSDAGKLWLSARSGMNITPQRLAGIPMHPVSLAGRHLPRRAQDASLQHLRQYAHPPPTATAACAADRPVTSAPHTGRRAGAQPGDVVIHTEPGRPAPFQDHPAASPSPTSVGSTASAADPAVLLLWPGLGGCQRAGGRLLEIDVA
jgi:Flavin-binding monooxygenase-like